MITLLVVVYYYGIRVCQKHLLSLLLCRHALKSLIKVAFHEFSEVNFVFHKTEKHILFLQADNNV